MATTNIPKDELEERLSEWAKSEVKKMKAELRRERRRLERKVRDNE